MHRAVNMLPSLSQCTQLSQCTDRPRAPDRPSAVWVSQSTCPQNSSPAVALW